MILRPIHCSLASVTEQYGAMHEHDDAGIVMHVADSGDALSLSCS